MSERFMDFTRRFVVFDATNAHLDVILATSVTMALKRAKWEYPTATRVKPLSQCAPEVRSHYGFR
jgi:hypothetical protein